MRLSLFHLNIEGGRKLERVIEYIKEQDFDLVHLQEVNGGSLSRTKRDNFDEIREKTGYLGSLALTTRLRNDPSSYFANATFFKPSLTLFREQIVWLKEYSEIEIYDRSDIEAIKQFPRNALALQFKWNEHTFWSINAHLAWGPNQYDEPHKIEQGRILYQFVAALKDPFILSGDFNVDKNSQTVLQMDRLGVNHAVQAGIINTLNPRLHRATHLFPPGLAVDFLYTSPTLMTDKFKLVDFPDLSDHLGLQIEVEL